MWPIPRVWALRNTLEAILKPGIPHQSFLGTCNRHRSLMWSMPPRHPDGNPCAEAMTGSWPPAIQGLRLDGDLQRMINEETEAIDVLFPLEKACVCMAKKNKTNNIALDHVMFLGNFAFLRAHNKPFCWFFGVFFYKKKEKQHSWDSWQVESWYLGWSNLDVWYFRSLNDFGGLSQIPPIPI